MISLAWAVWVIGSFGIGFCVVVAILYLRYWRTTARESFLLPLHVGATACGFLCISVYVVGSSYWIAAMPRWLSWVGLLGVSIITIGLGIAWLHVMRHGPMYRTPRGNVMGPGGTNGEVL